MRRRPGQDQEFLIRRQCGHEPRVVRPAGADKGIELFELLKPDRRLQIERFEVIAEMAVNVLVVVATR